MTQFFSPDHAFTRQSRRRAITTSLSPNFDLASSLAIPQAAKKYLKQNWGFPFVVDFVLLLMASAVELSAGLTDAANTTAVYAFYFLVIGVALQVVSYAKYGEDEASVLPKVHREPVPYDWTRKRVLAVALVVVVASGVSVTLLYPSSPVSVVPGMTYPKLTIKLDFVNFIHEPNDLTVAAVGVGAAGGNLPYNFTLIWPDNVVQTDQSGVFTRTFVSQSTPSTANVTVTSQDGQTASTLLNFT